MCLRSSSVLSAFDPGLRSHCAFAVVDLEIGHVVSKIIFEDRCEDQYGHVGLGRNVLQMAPVD